MRLVGASVPWCASADEVGWCAGGPYLNQLLQDLRAGLVHIVEETMDPAARAERDQQFRALSSMPADTDRHGRTVEVVQKHKADAFRMRRSDCALDPASPSVRYRFVSGPCRHIRGSGAPGLAWIRDATSPVDVVHKAAPVAEPAAAESAPR